MSKKFKTGLTVFIIIIVIVVATVSLSLLLPANNSSASNTGNPNGTSIHFDNGKLVKSGREYIAALYIEGTIEEKNYTYDQNWLLSTIETLKYDSNNVGIALYINSPGGAVYQADEIYLALKDYKLNNKVVYVYMGPLAASGGYYIACAADKIYANRNTLTGSIGVISSQVFDLTELLYNLGIESTTIYSGDNKNMGSFDEVFTEEQQEIMQTICDEYYEQFLSIVIDERKLPEKYARNLADGRIYTASQALNNGLIDCISDWNTMIKDLSYKTTNNAYCNVKAYKYEREMTFMEKMMNSFSTVKQSKAKSNSAMPLYLYQN